MSKIDISSLDKGTKNKIKKMAARCKALEKGVEFEIDVPKITIAFVWDSGEQGDAEYINDVHIDWETIEKQRDEIVAKYNAEVKEICAFSDSCADLLGVDRYEFFEQYLLP